MRTKKMTLFYTITPKDVIPPEPEVLAKKDEWIKQIQAETKAEWEPVQIKVEYRIYNPEVEQQRKFFNGPVVEYFIIQSMDMLQGTPDPATKRRYREELLDQVLGFDVELVDRTVRRRKSTADYTDTQEWHDFLEQLREDIFEPNGYKMPDSKEFWDLSKQYGYDKAKEISIKKLQEWLSHKLSTDAGRTGESA